MTNILKNYILPFLVGALLTVVIVTYTTLTNTLNPKLLIVMSAGAVTLALLLLSDTSRWFLFCLGVFSISFGYRSIHVGYWTYLVPFEIIVVGLWGALILTGMREKNRPVPVPGMFIFVAGWSLIHGFVSVIIGKPWDEVISWILPLVIGVPIFWVTGYMVKATTRLDTILRILLAVTAFMGVCEIVEYFLPGVAGLFPWYFNSQPIITQDGFIRGALGFWGYPAGASVIVFGMLVAYDNLFRSKDNRLRLISIAVFVLGAVAVYVSGTRSAWVGLGLGLILLSLSSKLKGIIPLVLAFGAGSILPPIFFARADTLVTLLSGKIGDTSILSRLARLNWGIEAIRSNPVWGVGYGHWLTHNAFLEIGSTIGIIPALAFLIFIIIIVLRVANVALFGINPDVRHYGWLFLAFALSWIVEINVETIFQTPPLAVAFWPILALSWYLPDLFQNQLKKGITSSSRSPVP